MNSVVCLDASVVIWALTPSPLSDKAAAVLAHSQKEKTSLVAPTLLAFEVTSTLRRLVYLHELTPKEGEEAFEAFLHLPVRLSHRRALFPLAWRLAKELNLSRAYDAAYLALAQLRHCDFWTADEKLYNTVKDRLSWVRWIGSYPEEDKD
jgi:predicted nucleic acid-binding protein